MPIKNVAARPVLVMDMPMSEVQTNGPNAAHAPVQPSICSPLAGEYANTIGYWRKVAALATPVIRNIQSIVQTNIGNWSSDVGARSRPHISTRHAMIGRRTNTKHHL